MRSTYTYAILEVPSEIYEYVTTKLKAAGYSDAFHEDTSGPCIDMHGLALRDNQSKMALHIEAGSQVVRLAMAVLALAPQIDHAVSQASEAAGSVIVARELLIELKEALDGARKEFPPA